MLLVGEKSIMPSFFLKIKNQNRNKKRKKKWKEKNVPILPEQGWLNNSHGSATTKWSNGSDRNHPKGTSRDKFNGVFKFGLSLIWFLLYMIKLRLAKNSINLRLAQSLCKY